MEQINETKFKIYSYGIVAENKEISSKEIMVTPIEISSMLDGEIKDNPTDLDTSGVDSNKQAYKTNIKTNNCKPATWLPFGSNRVTAPDVRRGEPVLIWNYGGSDKYYWTQLGLRDDLRRLETAVYAFNGNPDIGSKDFDPEDYYFLEVSTHSKQITLRTSNKNGEPFKYTCQFNTNDGVFTLADDTKNFFELNSKEVQMKMELNTGTKLHLDKMNFLLEAITEGKIKVGGTEMIFTPSLTTLKTPRFKGSR